MFEYELQKIHAAELIRRAEHQRLVREAGAARRRARRTAGNAPEGRVRQLRGRFDRAA
ncbi:hypothetical protein ACIBJC_37860 [Streptomyces sp. NPDC050509]|uniref:hypothetical protein n=1 Tax=Streptomyces sp. NPDC050509 TaxID=3365620 RepID=UPI003797495E